MGQNFIDPYSYPEDCNSQSVFGSLGKQEKSFGELRNFLDCMKKFEPVYGHMVEYQKLIKVIEEDFEAEAILLILER